MTKEIIMYWIKKIKNTLWLDNKKLLKFLVLIIIALLLFIFLIFFSSATLSFNIPQGENSATIWKIRLEIIFKNIVAASAIGSSNYLIQLFTRNKLADTSTIGINIFQQLTVAFFILFLPTFFNDYDTTYIFVFIYLSVGILSAIIYHFISFNTYFSSKRILVYGILLNIIVTSIAYFLLTSKVVNSDIIKIRFSIYQQKIFGGIKFSNDLSDLYCSSIILICCFIWIFCIRLKILSQCLNPFKMPSLGLNNTWVRFQLIILVAILGSVIFSLIGFIAFIGVSVSFIVSSLFRNFNATFFGSILISIIIMLISQFLQISLNHVATLSLSTLVGGVCFPIFIGFIIFKK